ncbi:MAG: nucleotidyltransferase [Bacteroidales bacterium]|nr:nucleotidyltransferase [Bacteroidales bacterium]
MKPTLVVLAAGMGSRYGSLKQMDAVGPCGEAIIDYSIYDAIRAGFGKVVFVIRHLFEKEFKEVFSAERFGGKIEVEFVFQELDYLPEGFTVPEGRVKPWGTNHAVMMAAPVVDTPFAVINSDDFYGHEGYQVLGDYLRSVEGKKGAYSMCGYYLKNTLSDFGSVSRGECSVDAGGNLTGMVERLGIERQKGPWACACGKSREAGEVTYKDEEGLHPISEDCIVSMNLFGFTPDYFAESERLFKVFLSDPANLANPKAEFFIPLAVNSLISEGKASMKVLSSAAKWFGVTYKEDKPDVVAKIRALVDAGVYPENLWGK